MSCPPGHPADRRSQRCSALPFSLAAPASDRVYGGVRLKLASTGLTELESHALSIIWRMQPITAYEVRQAFAQSPTRNVALSQGSIYPLVERLKKQGYVRGAPVKGDRRKSEHLECTSAGEEAIRDWIREMGLQLPEDPLRSKVLAIGLLPKAERTEWARSVRTALLRDLANIEEFAQSYPGPLFEIAHDNARATLLARIRWIERIEGKLDEID